MDILSSICSPWMDPIGDRSTAVKPRDGGVWVLAFNLLSDETRETLDRMDQSSIFLVLTPSITCSWAYPDGKLTAPQGTINEVEDMSFSFGGGISCLDLLPHSGLNIRRIPQIPSTVLSIPPFTGHTHASSGIFKEHALIVPGVSEVWFITSAVQCAETL
ncbi:hypothetical protein BD779DRAFT_634275 [Infundibulicybe gibba]|nr:hypothetical protein BD779DRAFT_634275 [Infundibulicybe gibba]